MSDTERVLSLRPDQTVASTLEALTDRSLTVEDRAAAFGLLHQVQLRVNRALRSVKDEIIVYMESNGLRELGPLSIKASAIDPRYVVNEPGNHDDSMIQDALAGLRSNPATAGYVRHVVEHLEIDVPALVEGMRLGSKAALDLYAELNRRKWRVEDGRRLSLAVREVKAPSEGKAA